MVVDKAWKSLCSSDGDSCGIGGDCDDGQASSPSKPESAHGFPLPLVTLSSRQ